MLGKFCPTIEEHLTVNTEQTETTHGKKKMCQNLRIKDFYVLNKASTFKHHILTHC